MRIALGVCAVIGILMLFGAAMTQAVTYDEDQYIAAGILARSWLPYRDFRNSPGLSAGLSHA